MRNWFERLARAFDRWLAKPAGPMSPAVFTGVPHR